MKYPTIEEIQEAENKLDWTDKVYYETVLFTIINGQGPTPEECKKEPLNPGATNAQRSTALEFIDSLRDTSLPRVITIIKEEDDPIALRASIGGKPSIGYYLMYRGKEEEVLAMLERVLAEFKNDIKNKDN